MTIHYELQVDFSDIPSFVVIKTTSEDKAIKQLARIKDFVGLPVTKYDLKVIDESVSQYKRRAKYQDRV